MLRSVIAVAVGLACAAVVGFYITGAATFGMDRRGDVAEVPLGLWLLIALTAASVGFTTWRMVRRR